MEEAQHVGQQACRRKAGEHDVEREAADVFIAAARCGERDAGHAEHDRRHGDVLDATRPLAEHSLAHEHQHQQPCCERWLHDDQRRQQERDHLQRPAEHRETGAEEPPLAPDQPRDEGEPQVRLGGSLLGVHRLEGDPYAVEARGHNGREQPKDEIEHDRR
jgi:hypothetical protein